MNRAANTPVPAPMAKQMYREFAASEPTLPIFSRDWWLDATAGADGWDVALVAKGDHVAAAMPYVMRRRYGMTVLGQPPLTHKLGPWFRAIEGKPATRLAHEKDLMQALIDQLPAFDHFAQNWHYSRTNWLPFSWNGFEQTTRYTYVLSDIAATEKIWAGFENSTRAECKKGMDRFKLQVKDDVTLDDFLALNRQTFERQGMQVPYSDALVRRIDAACGERSCRKFFIAIDPEGRHHAGNYIVWDEHSAYGLMNGADSAFRNSGAASLCMWNAIRYASGVTRHFDFAGSMMEPVERFLRGFGAVQVPYSNISKTPSRLLRMRQFLRPVVRDRHRRASAA